MLKSLKKVALLSAAILLSIITVLEQDGAAQQLREAEPSAPVSQAKPSDVEQLKESVRRLEEQLRQLQQQLNALTQTAATRNEPPVVSPSDSGTTRPKVENTAKPETAKSATQQKPTGVDLANAKLTPYGTIYFNAFNNSRGVNNQDVPLFATPTGQGAASASVRQTRLGLKLDGGRVGSAKLSGVIEADFFGGIPAIGVGENFGVVRLRLANARLDWEKTSLTVGQDWMVFAPLNPVSLAAAAIPQMAAAGNNWARLPQVRVDRKLTDHITVSAAVLTPQTGDHPTTSSFFLQPTTGAASHIPFFQSRIAFAGKNWFGWGKVGGVGISGHYGRSKAGTARDGIDSTAVALDWNLPLHKRLTWTGEIFTGRSLGGFQAGIFQGINTEFAYRSGASVRPAGSRGIGTSGGWTQVGFTPNAFGDRLSVYGSVGIDDPRDSDLSSVSRFNFRSRNMAYAVNAIFKLTPQFQLGAEFRRFETSYLNTGRSLSEHLNVGASYSF